MSCKVQEMRQSEIAIAVDVSLESADGLITDDNEIAPILSIFSPFFLPFLW